MSEAVRIVGKTGSDVSFSCFPLAGKAVLCCGKGFSGQTKAGWCVAVWCIWLAVRGLP